MQQIPANALPEDRQNDYRNCFIPGRDGWSLVGSDYSSQELCVIATLSQDPIFIDALKTGKDLHSVCAELVWGTQWTDATDKDCAFYKLKEDGQPAKAKCKCAGHGKLRDDTKAVSFGLAYGLSPKGLANDIHVTVEEASQIFDRYFIAFEGIKSILDGFGEYGKNNGFIRTIAPFRRKRYFPYWNGPSTAKGLLSQIERASKNMPRLNGHVKPCEFGEN